jgi:hypothetical protein
MTSEASIHALSASAIKSAIAMLPSPHGHPSISSNSADASQLSAQGSTSGLISRNARMFWIASLIWLSGYRVVSIASKS